MFARAFGRVFRGAYKGAARWSRMARWTTGAVAFAAAAPVLNLQSLERKIAQPIDYDVDFHEVQSTHMARHFAPVMPTQVVYAAAFGPAQVEASDAVSVLGQAAAKLKKGGLSAEETQATVAEALFAYQTVTELFLFQLVSNVSVQECDGISYKDFSANLTDTYFALLTESAKQLAVVSKHAGGANTSQIDRFVTVVQHKTFPHNTAGFLSWVKSSRNDWSTWPQSFKQVVWGLARPKVARPTVALMCERSPELSPMSKVVSDWRQYRK